MIIGALPRLQGHVSSRKITRFSFSESFPKRSRYFSSFFQKMQVSKYYIVHHEGNLRIISAGLILKGQSSYEVDRITLLLISFAIAKKRFARFFQCSRFREACCTCECHVTHLKKSRVASLPGRTLGRGALHNSFNCHYILTINSILIA